MSAGGGDPEEREFRARVREGILEVEGAHGLDHGDVAALLGLRNPYANGKVTVSRWATGRTSPARYLPLALLALREKLARDPGRWKAWLAGRRAAETGGR